MPGQMQVCEWMGLEGSGSGACAELLDIDIGLSQLTLPSSY
jgi:hypothetical protein